ncbi:MAG: hypothetical protein K9J37_05975 [Saprospiraceae bacterium]|nr:hypothetical protein [Saprospiraceae bacterium]MCF8249439.1 hypothetical protein [Saprospiraceae bacterium]MCF8279093.1 hypothetical protein [Bacteroidales bacterium]MCF8311568.1 hypothetical protein [Saprospiraceae bacterium]MCF8440058.1 hypothetical protein [Saprospiraceae bacterium]
MVFKLKPANFFFWVLSIGLGIAGLSFAGLKPHKDLQSQPIPHTSYLIPHTPSNEDTMKYRGFRLELINFEILKQTDDWVKVRCDVVNSGRMDVNFSKKGTLHWVQFIFDHTLFSYKLGGLRENIRYTLYEENFKLAAGQTLRGKELKVPVVIVKKNTLPPPVADGFETKVGTPTAALLEADDPTMLAGKGGEEEPASTTTLQPGIADDCPDIYFYRLHIIGQDDKWATIEYTIANKGFGTFKLFDKGSKNEEKLVVNAFISGVPTLSRGALSAGGQIVKPLPGQTGDLLPGDTYTGQMKVDVRKKTRYMKSLILSLDSDQFRFECDKTNNTDAVILD